MKGQVNNLKNLKSLMKLLCSVVCVAVLFSSFSVITFAQEVTDVKTIDESAIGLLSALDIIDYTEENIDEKITRGEFFKMVCLASGYGETEVKGYNFEDLGKDHPYRLYKIGRAHV